MAVETYHVYVAGRRTTVTLDVITARFLSCALDREGGIENSAQCLKQWVEQEVSLLTAIPDEGLAAFLRERALKTLAGPEIAAQASLRKYW